MNDQSSVQIDDGSVGENRPPWQDYEVLNEREAAEFLRYNLQTLRNWRRSGGGPRYVKSHPGRSGRVTYRLEALREWALSHEIGSTWEAPK
jgi:hypothetical protein